MNKISKKHNKEIAALAVMADAEIDTSDISEIKNWNGAMVGKFYRPIKQPVTIRLDADVLAWIKSQGRGYQTRINSLLRETMMQSGKKRAAKAKSSGVLREQAAKLHTGHSRRKSKSRSA